MASERSSHFKTLVCLVKKYKIYIYIRKNIFPCERLKRAERRRGVLTSWMQVDLRRGSKHRIDGPAVKSGTAAGSPTVGINNKLGGGRRRHFHFTYSSSRTAGGEAFLPRSAAGPNRNLVRLTNKHRWGSLWPRVGISKSPPPENSWRGLRLTPVFQFTESTAATVCDGKQEVLSMKLKWDNETMFEWLKKKGLSENRSASG